MTKPSPLRLAAAVLAGLAAAIPADAAGPPSQAAPPTVTVSPPVRRQVVDWDEFTGQFAAVEYVELRARVSGYLTEIHFEDGQIVRQGDLLFVIDPRPFRIALAQAEAQLQQAEASLVLANRQLARAGQLRHRDFVAQSTYDQQLQQTQAATASVAGAKAQVAAAQLNLEYTNITAPTGGRIGAHQVSVGNLVTGGGTASASTLLTTIVSLDPIYLSFDMSEADYLRYKRQAAEGEAESPRQDPPAYVQLTDETGWPHQGHLDFLDNQIDRSAGTIRARVVMANHDLLITPGAFARIRLAASKPYEALLVPDAAVTADQARATVMTVAADGTVVSKAIRPGPLEGGLRVVREGLSPDDRVIIDGLIRARPGAKVTAQAGTIRPEG
jgi:RND family efflux transporter MFP subunit